MSRRLLHVINSIQASGLKHQTFCAFLEETGAVFGILLNHMDVHWLNHMRVLKRFVGIKEEVYAFFNNGPKDFPELKDDNWNKDLWLLTDMMTHLNELNLQLQ